MTEQLPEVQRRLLEILHAHQYVTETTLATLLGRGWHNALWSCMRRGWIDCIADVDDDIPYVVFCLTCAGRPALLDDAGQLVGAGRTRPQRPARHGGRRDTAARRRGVRGGMGRRTGLGPRSVRVRVPSPPPMRL